MNMKRGTLIKCSKCGRINEVVVELKINERYPQDQSWYHFIDMNDCTRFSTCQNCTLKTCPVVEKAKEEESG